MGDLGGCCCYHGFPHPFPCKFKLHFGGESGSGTVTACVAAPLRGRRQWGWGVRWPPGGTNERRHSLGPANAFLQTHPPSPPHATGVLGGGAGFLPSTVVVVVVGVVFASRGFKAVIDFNPLRLTRKNRHIGAGMLATSCAVRHFGSF